MSYHVMICSIKRLRCYSLCITVPLIGYSLLHAFPIFMSSSLSLFKNFYNSLISYCSFATLIADEGIADHLVMRTENFFY